MLEEASLKYFVVIGLFIVGFLVGGELWFYVLVPPWPIPMFLLPAAIYIDHFAIRGQNAWKWTRYSTTVGVLCVGLIAIFHVRQTCFGNT